MAETQRLDEGDRMAAIPSIEVGTSPELLAMPALSNRMTSRSLAEAVGHQRIPMVHVAKEMNVEDERHAAGLAQTAGGEADALASTNCVGAV